MTRSAAKRVAGATALCALLSFTSLSAQLGVGTWVKQGDSGPALAMTVEACCGNGYRLIYRVVGQTAIMMTVESALDGKEAPVLLMGGKPSGETMAITRIDAHHLSTVLKMNGQPYGTSKATLSADGKTLTVENEVTKSAVPGQPAGKTTEVWVRK